jgi:hypothetical protein
MTTSSGGSPQASADCVRDAVALVTALSGGQAAGDFLAVWPLAARHPARDLAWALAGLAAAALHVAEQTGPLRREQLLAIMGETVNRVADEP